MSYPNQLCELEAVHPRHLNVRKNQPDRPRAALLLKASLVKDKGLSPRLETLAFDVELLKEYSAERNQIEWFVIQQNN